MVKKLSRPADDLARLRNAVRCVAGVASIAFFLATPLAAQTPSRSTPSDSRWAPWLGCWSPVSVQRTTQDVQVCILPTDDGTGVRMATFAADQSVLEEPVVADGAPHLVTEGNCEGQRQTRWARSGARLLTTTELRCESQPPQQTSGLSTLVSTNQWLDIQTSGPAGRESVRIRRYVRSGENPPAAVAAAIGALPPPSVAATSRLAFDDVIEAAESVSQKAVEAWLVETEPKVTVNRQALRKMSDARVPEPVIDLLVALAYPRRFEVRTPSGGLGSSSVFIAADHTGFFDWAGPWAGGYDPYMQCYAPFVGYCPYGAYDYYGTYDYWYPGGGYVTAPLPPGPANPIAPVPPAHGQAVNGHGYTQVTPREAVAAQSSGDGHSDSGSSSTSGSSFSGGSSGGSSASPAGYSSGGGGGGGGVTAVPR